MEKLDLFKQFKAEYVSPKKPVLVDTEKAQFICVRGQGEPGGEAFQAAIEALYGVAYTMKFTCKFAGGQDYKVCALEGVYEDKCDWRLLIRTPDFMTKADLKKTIATLIEKGKPETVKKVELIKLKEGQCAQVLQVGPYDSVCRTMETLRAFATEQGLEFAGPLHEIYLSDPRRVAPEKLKTIIRQPVRKSA